MEKIKIKKRIKPCRETGKMKGGLEHPVVAVLLVVLGVLVISLTIGFYIRSAVTGEPIQVKTYTEYRWMNYFPSSVLFYLSYLPETWDAINEITQLPCDEVKLRKRTEFYNEFSPKLQMDYREGFNKFNELMGDLEEHTKKEKHSYIIKDEKGLVISLGLPGNMLDVSKPIVFPEEYPYNCFYKDMPILSKETENMRVKFIFCCGDVNYCDDYLAGAGRNECVENPCGIGPCKLDICGNKELMDQQSAERYRIACLDKKEGVRVCVSDPVPEEEAP